MSTDRMIGQSVPPRGTNGNKEMAAGQSLLLSGNFKQFVCLGDRMGGRTIYIESESGEEVRGLDHGESYLLFQKI